MAKKKATTPKAEPVVSSTVFQVVINEDDYRRDPVYLVAGEGRTPLERQNNATEKALARFHSDNPTDTLDSFKIGEPDDSVDAIIA